MTEGHVEVVTRGLADAQEGAEDVHDVADVAFVVFLRRGVAEGKLGRRRGFADRGAGVGGLVAAVELVVVVFREYVVHGCGVSCCVVVAAEDGVGVCADGDVGVGEGGFWGVVGDGEEVGGGEFVAVVAFGGEVGGEGFVADVGGFEGEGAVVAHAAGHWVGRWVVC